MRQSDQILYNIIANSWHKARKTSWHTNWLDNWAFWLANCFGQAVANLYLLTSTYLPPQRSAHTASHTCAHCHDFRPSSLQLCRKISTCCSTPAVTLTMLVLQRSVAQNACSVRLLLNDLSSNIKYVDSDLLNFVLEKSWACLGTNLHGPPLVYINVINYSYTAIVQHNLKKLI